MDKHKTKISLSAPTAASKDQSDRLAISKKNLSKSKSKSRDEREIEEDPLSAPTPKAKKVVVQPIKLDLQPVSQEILEGVTKHPLLLMVLIAANTPAPSSAESNQGQPSESDFSPKISAPASSVHRTKSTDSGVSPSHPATSSAGNGEVRIVIKVYDTVTSTEALHYINQREYTLFLDEYCTHVASDKARGVFQPGNLAFWSANIRKIIQIQEKSSGDGKLKISIAKKALTEVITALLVEKKEHERSSTPSSPTSTLRKGLPTSSSSNIRTSSPSTQNRSSTQHSTTSVRQPTPEKPQSKQQQQRPVSNQKKDSHQTSKPKSASTRLQTDPSSSSGSKRSSSPSAAKTTPKSSTTTVVSSNNTSSSNINNPNPSDKRQSMPNVKLNDYSLLPSSSEGNSSSSNINKSQKNLLSSKEPSSTTLPISKTASSDNITPALTLASKSKSNVSVEKQTSQSKIVPDLKKEKSVKEPPSSAPAQMSRQQSKSKDDQNDNEYDADFETPTVPPTAIPVQRQQSQQQQQPPAKQPSSKSLKNPSLDQGSDYAAYIDEKEELKEYLQDKPHHRSTSAKVPSSSREPSIGQLSSSIVTNDDTHSDPAFNEFFENIDFNQVRKSISVAATKSASRDRQDDNGAVPSLRPDSSAADEPQQQQRQQHEPEILQLDQQSLVEEIDEIDGKYSSIFEEGNNNNTADTNNGNTAASSSIYEESFSKEESIPTIKSQKSSSIKMNNSNSIIDKYGEDDFESMSGFVQSESLSQPPQPKRKSNNQEESFDEEEIIEENSSIAIQDKIQANEREDDNRGGNVQHPKNKLEDPSYYTEFEDDEDLYTIDD
jgi:hypothetical protein